MSLLWRISSVASKQTQRFLPHIIIYPFSIFKLDKSAMKETEIVWQRNRLTLHESTHNGFLQIMHPMTFHINNPSDAKLASLSILIKWPVSMATIVKIEKNKK